MKLPETEDVQLDTSSTEQKLVAPFSKFPGLWHG